MAAGARWLREEVIGSVEVQVPLRVELRKVTVEADVRSPGGTKPMRREYEYIPTRDAAAAFGEAYGEKVHHENVAERDRVQREIEQAQAQKRRIEARRRDSERRACNKSQVGTARRPKCAACDPARSLQRAVRRWLLQLSNRSQVSLSLQKHLWRRSCGGNERCVRGMRGV